VLRNNFGREKKRVNIDFKHMNEMNKSNLLLPVPSTFHAPSLLGHTQNLFLLLLFISPLYLLLLRLSSYSGPKKKRLRERTCLEKLEAYHFRGYLLH
jgi:hypothetical protein